MSTQSSQPPPKYLLAESGGEYALLRGSASGEQSPVLTGLQGQIYARAHTLLALPLDHGIDYEGANCHTGTNHVANGMGLDESGVDRPYAYGRAITRETLMALPAEAFPFVIQFGNPNMAPKEPFIMHSVVALGKDGDEIICCEKSYYSERPDLRRFSDVDAWYREVRGAECPLYQYVPAEAQQWFDLRMPQMIHGGHA